MTVETQPRIGGWLILPAIETWLEPLFYALPILRASSLLLTNRPQPLPLPIVITDCLLAGLLCVCWIYAIVLMRNHSRFFPRTYIALHVAQLGAIAIQLAEKWRAGMDTGHTAVFFGRAALTAVLWTSYMYFSKRVKATFVK